MNNPVAFEIEGGHKLSGEIIPQGAKNEALQVICGTLLTDEEVIINNIPEILDVLKLIDLVRGLNVKVDRLSKGSYMFKADNLNLDYLTSNDFNKIGGSLRGSLMLVGPLLAGSDGLVFRLLGEIKLVEED